MKQFSYASIISCLVLMGMSLNARTHHLAPQELRKLLFEKKAELQELRNQIEQCNEAEITLIKAELEVAEIDHEIERAEDSLRTFMIEEETSSSVEPTAPAHLEKAINKAKTQREHARNAYTSALSKYLIKNSSKNEIIRHKESIFADVEELVEKLKKAPEEFGEEKAAPQPVKMHKKIVQEFTEERFATPVSTPESKPSLWKRFKEHPWVKSWFEK